MDGKSLISSLAFWTFSVLAAVLCAAVAVVPRLERHARLSAQVDRLRAEIEQIAQANQHLARQVEALETDPFYVEQIARRELGFHRPGEQRLTVGPLYVPAPPRRPLPPETPPWLHRLQRLFAHDANTRRAALVTAAVLILCAFVFFNRPAASPSAQTTTEPAADPIPDDEVVYPPRQRLAG